MTPRTANKPKAASEADQAISAFLQRFPRRRSGPLERKLVKVMEKPAGERQVHAFLKRHDFLVGMAFRSNTHTRAVVSEFQFGAEFRCDFLVLSCCSAWWSADFIELESPNAPLYLADGTEAKALRVAKRQVREWRQWTRQNDAYLRQRLSALFSQLGTCASGASSVPDAATEILLPHCLVSCAFHIVIGRRPHLSRADQFTRAEDSLEGGVSIATYDRFLDVARRYDEADQAAKEAFEYWKT